MSEEKRGCSIKRKESREMRKSIWPNNVQQGASPDSTKQLIIGYSQWIQRYVDYSGWNAFLMSFMFKPLKGNDGALLSQMSDEVDRVYSTFLTRVVRKPRSDSLRYWDVWRYYMPVLIAVPDSPVAKRRKQSLNDVTINNGLHMHGILVVPWQSRLRRDVVSQFQKDEKIYVKNRLLRLDVRPIQSNLGGVVDYAFKSIKTRKFDHDDILVLPKSIAELHEPSQI
jgi:hypothetical protein